MKNQQLRASTRNVLDIRASGLVPADPVNRPVSTDLRRVVLRATNKFSEWRSNSTKLIAPLPLWVRVLLAESLPLLVIVLGLTIEIRHLATSEWRQLFLYNGNSITFPLIQQSLAHKEAFQWVFSSPFFLFPEILLYGLCSLVTTSIGAALILNAYLNMVILYVLVRVIVGSCLVNTATVKRILATAMCLVLIFEMLLERSPAVNQQTIATFFLFTTYYYGVILAGLGTVCIALYTIKRSARAKSLARDIIVPAASLLLALLTTFSDPLYVLQFAIPFFLTVSLLFILRRLTIYASLAIILPQAFGILLGYLWRIPFKDFVGQSVNTYINIQNIPSSLHSFYAAATRALQTNAGALELGIVLGIIIFSDIYSLYLIRRLIARQDSKLSNQLLFVTIFAGLSPWVITLSIIFTGNTTTRYLLPVVIFPLIGLAAIPNFRSIFSRFYYINLGAWTIFLTIAAGGLMSLPSIRKLDTTNNFSDSICLANVLSHKPANGVAEYWYARPLDLYGLSQERVLQVNANLTVFPWINNLGAYPNKLYTFVIVDKQVSGRAILPSDLVVLRAPSSVSNCPDFYVYDYAKGTYGSTLLTKKVLSSYQSMLRLRNSGELAKFLTTIP